MIPAEAGLKERLETALSETKLQEYKVGDAITFTYTQESKDAAMVITNVE